MKTNTKTQMATLAKIVAVTAVLAFPGAAFADDMAVTPTHNGRNVYHAEKAAVQALGLQHVTAGTVQFNLIDGEPIR